MSIPTSFHMINWMDYLGNASRRVGRRETVKGLQDEATKTSPAKNKKNVRMSFGLSEPDNDFFLCNVFEILSDRLLNSSEVDSAMVRLWLASHNNLAS